MRIRIAQKHIPLLSTVAVCVLLYALASALYPRFFSLRVFCNFFIGNSFLGIIAVGMTFVILSGGIDLSVGSMMALASVVTAELVPASPLLAFLAALAMGAAIGLGMGCVVRYFGLPPFIVTLAGMFFARGMAFIISVESVSIESPFYSAASNWGLEVGRARVPVVALVFLAVVAAGIYASVHTVFGRNVYAIGGNEEASLLMGIPVGRTKILVYVLSGVCSALAGIVYTIYTSSGNPTAGVGLELDAIAAVVVGGTLLTGGVGYVFGTLVGVLIFGIIQTGITFQGTLSSSWTKVAIGVLLLFFILLQKLFARPGLRTH